jgi:hypothetical protein
MRTIKSVRTGLGAFALAAALTLCCLCVQGWAASSPKAVVPAPNYDFGTIRQGEKVSHCFELANRGTASLKTGQMELSLPDMTARATASIAPGKTGQVCVELGTSSLSLKVTARVLVILNDLTQPRIPLVLTGVVKAPIDLVPMGAVFAAVWKGERAERSVMIVNNQPKPLHVRGLETEGQYFTAKLVTEKADQVYKVTVEVPPNAPPGRYTGFLYVDTDDARFSRIRLGVNIFIKDEIYTFPGGVAFGTVNLAQVQADPSMAISLNESFLVKKRAGKFAIKSIASDVPEIETTQTPTGESNTFRVDVTLSRHLQPGSLAGKIRVLTDDPAVPVLIVPVSGQIVTGL